MKTPLSSSMRASGCGSAALTNCGRNARKKIDSFGFRRLTSTAETITRAAERGPISFPP
jgi:hypothetical protein